MSNYVKMLPIGFSIPPQLRDWNPIDQWDYDDPAPAWVAASHHWAGQGHHHHHHGHHGGGGGGGEAPGYHLGRKMGGVGADWALNDPQGQPICCDLRPIPSDRVYTVRLLRHQPSWIMNVADPLSAAIPGLKDDGVLMTTAFSEPAGEKQTSQGVIRTTDETLLVRSSLDAAGVLAVLKKHLAAPLFEVLSVEQGGCDGAQARPLGDVATTGSSWWNNYTKLGLVALAAATFCFYMSKKAKIAPSKSKRRNGLVAPCNKDRNPFAVRHKGTTVRSGLGHTQAVITARSMAIATPRETFEVIGPSGRMIDLYKSHPEREMPRMRNGYSRFLLYRSRPPERDHRGRIIDPFTEQMLGSFPTKEEAVTAAGATGERGLYVAFEPTNAVVWSDAAKTRKKRRRNAWTTVRVKSIKWAPDTRVLMVGPSPKMIYSKATDLAAALLDAQEMLGYPLGHGQWLPVEGDATHYGDPLGKGKPGEMFLEVWET